MAQRTIYGYSDLTNSTIKKKEIGIGLEFLPNSVFTSTYTTNQSTKNQLINYLMTNPGERPFDPYFGAGLKGLVFEQNVDLDSLEDSLKEGIENNVQNITVKNITVNGQNNTINIKINYSVNNITDELNIELNSEI